MSVPRLPGPPLRLPAAPGPPGEIWTTLCELAAAKPDGWTLIGGQMVLLLTGSLIATPAGTRSSTSGARRPRRPRRPDNHPAAPPRRRWRHALEQRPGAAAERGGNRVPDHAVWRPRPARLEGGEADATHPAPSASARRAPSAAVSNLRSSRYARGHSVIDVLAPEGLGARADLTTTPPRRPGVAGATALEQRPGAAAERGGNRVARPRCLARPRPARLEGGEADATHPAPRGASARRARLRPRCRTSGVPRCGPRGIRPRHLGVSPPPGGPVAAWRHHNVHL